MMAGHYSRMFTELTGIESQVIEYYDGPDMQECEKGCSFCRWAEQIAQPEIDCRRVVTRAGQQAAKFAGKHAFFCNSGFIHFVTPIRLLNEHIATFVGGPVQICDREELLVDTVMNKLSIDPIYRKEAVKRIVDVPNVMPYKVGKAMDIMAAISSHIARIGDSYVREDSLAGDHNFWTNLQLENRLIEGLEREDMQRTTATIQEIAKTVQAHFIRDIHGEFKSGKDVLLSHIIKLALLYVDHHLSNYMDVEYDLGLRYIALVQNAEDPSQLQTYMDEFNQEFIDKVFRKEKIVHSAVINKVIDYINHNYMNKITLENTAEFAYLSSSYLSKIFKEEVGCNFNTYLNKLRIEKAKKLLTDDNINIVEVSNLVGYEDQSYFSKVFRRITGTTPKKYKDNQLFR